MDDPQLVETVSVSETDPASPSKGRRGTARIRSGDCFGRYTVRRLLGRGGMGEVFEAHDPQLDRVVALKVLRPELVETSARSRTRFLREAQAMGRLNHPNVVSIYDVGIDGTRLGTGGCRAGWPRSSSARGSLTPRIATRRCSTWSASSPAIRGGPAGARCGRWAAR